MVKIIYGPKGFGKTKIMIDDVNSAVETSSGNVVFITDKKISTVGINFNVRFISLDDFKISDGKSLASFVKGLIAGNGDIEYIFIDGLKRIVGDALVDGELVFDAIDALQKEYSNLKFEISISAEKKELPEYISKFVE